MPLNLQEAISELRTNPSSYQTPESLANLVNQVSADAPALLNTMLRDLISQKRNYNDE